MEFWLLFFRSIFVLRRVVLRRNDQTLAFASPSIDYLQYVDELLLVFQSPYHLIVVSCPKVHHDVPVSEKEHHSASVIQFVHRVEVGHFIRVYHIELGELLDCFGALYEDLIHLHAGLVSICPKPDAHYPVLL